MIKMFASDLDGTLLNALHEADGTIRRAIRELTEAGCMWFPRPDARRCRSASMALRAGARRLLLQRSIVRESHGDVLKTWTIDPQITEELLKEFPDICFLISSTPNASLEGRFSKSPLPAFKREAPLQSRLRAWLASLSRVQYFDQSIGDILRHDV